MVECADSRHATLCDADSRGFIVVAFCSAILHHWMCKIPTEVATLTQLECCPITRESIYIPLTLQEYLAVTEQSEGSYIEVDVKVVSAEKFKEKLPSKGEASFLDHAQYAEYIEGLTQGLSSLQKANLASEESW
ncbi:hypothetical protein PsalN5692_02756 [Piscirickettsia salmonis]|nr:hypothetical protein PsalN5692_02756 [Piscirickettsia salmonis]